MGHEQSAPNPLAYLSAGIAANFHTSLQQAVEVMGLAIDEMKVEAKVDFSWQAPFALDWAGFTDRVTANDARSITLLATLSATGSESYLLATQLGLGLAQLPRFHIADDLLSGKRLRVLPDIPIPSVPVSIPYARNRQLSLRVRVFIDWLVQRCSTGLSRPLSGQSR